MPGPSETTRILDQLCRAFNGEPWSGPSLLTTLEGVTAAEAASRPVPAAHSIWEIVQHLTACSALMCRRLAANQLLQLSDAEDWPAHPPMPTEAQWQAVLAALQAAHEQLVATATAIPAAGLDQRIGQLPGQPPGPEAGSTVYVTLHGIAQHYLYHAGQIALLRKSAPPA